MGEKTPVGIIGASGYVGAELMRLLAGHPKFDLRFVTAHTQADNAVVGLYPHLGSFIAEQFPNIGDAAGDHWFEEYSPDLLDDEGLVFLALPHGASQEIVADILSSGTKVVDLAADFRLTDPAQYEKWYGEPHKAPDLLDKFVYGLPELFKEQLTEQTAAVAVPGCYPTAAALALAPLIRGGWIQEDGSSKSLIQSEGIIVDAASGVSGAGRPPKDHTTFCAVDENFSAYGLLNHRHTPEIEQAVGGQVLFTPHLAPMNRGILATCYARPAQGLQTADFSREQLDTAGVSFKDNPVPSDEWDFGRALTDRLHYFYKGNPFVRVSLELPSTKDTLGSNAAHLTARYDDRTNTVVVLCAIDNLGKGAAGQAIQCANLICGLEEAEGLTAVGVYP
ncbi:MAG: N-acetyl-gamma-glutamyl-phosphate reductase [bacterium]|nr:N-acetyl-gamma-glutamyl-phosphate reductase [bacterium]